MPPVRNATLYIDNELIYQEAVDFNGTVTSAGLFVGQEPFWLYSGSGTFIGFADTELGDVTFGIGDPVVVPAMNVIMMLYTREQSQQLTTVDISTLTNYSQLVKGTSYTVKVRAVGSGLYTNSNYSVGVTYSRPYTITTTITNGTYSGDTTIVSGSTASVTVVPGAGYTYPTSVTVTGASSSYDSSTGVISLSNPTADVVISATCIASALATPTISISGDTLTITDTDSNSTQYRIYVNGSLATTINKST